MPYRLLDTNIVSFLIKQHSLAATYQQHLTGFDLAVSFQTVGELLSGGAMAGWGAQKWADLDVLLSSMTVLHSDAVVCLRWAEVLVARRRRPIGLADAWIAATALAHTLELVTHNPNDFVSIPGLIVVTEAP